MKFRIGMIVAEPLATRLEELLGTDIIDVEPEAAPTPVLRATIIHLLGGKCIRCGSKSDLVVHHLLGGGSILRAMFGYRGEMLRIAHEWNNGKYAAACQECHAALEPDTFRRLPHIREQKLKQLQSRHAKIKTRIKDEIERILALHKYPDYADAIRCKYQPEAIVKRLYKL